MATIFPDVEVLLVDRLKDTRDASTDPLWSGVRIATIKPHANTSPYPSKLVIVRCDGGTTRERGLVRTERVGISVYAADYASASNLARLVESSMRTYNYGDIKLVETILSPTRVEEKSTDTDEKRYITFEVTTKASSL